MYLYIKCKKRLTRLKCLDVLKSSYLCYNLNKRGMICLQAKIRLCLNLLPATLSDRVYYSGFFHSLPKHNLFLLNFQFLHTKLWLLTADMLFCNAIGPNILNKGNIYPNFKASRTNLLAPIECHWPTSSQNCPTCKEQLSFGWLQCHQYWPWKLVLSNDY
jgi:hypothetical protein